MSTVSQRPIAWANELAHAYCKATGEYSDWGPPVVRFKKPCVTAGSIRNLRPLYGEPVCNPIGHDHTMTFT